MAYFTNFKTIEYDINGDGIFDDITNLSAIAKISDNLIGNATFYDLVNINDGERPEQLSYRLYGSTNYYWTFLMINKNINNIWNDWPKSSSQLKEYCEHKYEYIAAITKDNMYYTNSVTGITSAKFEIGAMVTASSGAIGIIKEIHRNNKYLVIEVTSGEFNPAGETIYTPTNADDSINCTSIVSNAYAPKFYLDISTGVPTAPRSTGTYAYTNYQFENMLNDKNMSIKVIKPDLISDIISEFNIEISQ
jgi:hypothetical protein